MTAVREPGNFKKAIYISLLAHLGVFLLIIVSPSLPKPTKKRGMTYYIPLNMVGPGGSGGGRGTLAAAKAAPAAKKETLKDLTTAQKVQQETKAAMRYPVEKPKKEEPKTKTEKKAAISKPEPATPLDTTSKSAAETGLEGTGGMGTGLRIGGGGGPGNGWGPGGPGGTLANFPYTWYLNVITDRVSGNWFSSLVDPGVSGNFQTVIYFRIEKNGQVSEVRVEQSSGVTPLDLSAIRAVKASAPFPPLPRDYEDAYLAIHLIFEHSK
jgi:TonB family protein